jgi:hypothetical protein
MDNNPTGLDVGFDPQALAHRRRVGVALDSDCIHGYILSLLFFLFDTNRTRFDVGFDL